MSSRSIWLLFFSCLIVLSGFSSRANSNQGIGQSHQKKATTKVEASGNCFIENAGQLLDDQGKPASGVKFYGKFPGYNLYFTSGSLVYEFYEQKEPSQIQGKTGFDIPIQTSGGAVPSETTKKFRLDMAFKGANQGVQIYAAGKRKSYHNYYHGGDELSEFLKVSLFDTIFYRNIYPDIDLVFYLLPEGKGLKYDFVIHPGANPGMIKYAYEGAENLTLNEAGELIIKTPMGILKEEKPFSYQKDKGFQKKIPSSFKLSANSAGFFTGKYDTSSDLIIDPSILVWSTYYGGNGSSEQSIHMTTDASGNLLLCGNTNGTTFPTSTGAIQTAFGGGNMDGFVLKFSPDGTRIWGTYFGGSREDNARSCEADAAGNIFITGTTMSLNFPLLNPGGGAFFQAVNTASSLVSTNPTTFIARISPAGTLFWSSYFGGNTGESGTDVWVDASNNVLFTGCTASTNFSVTAGAFQTVMAGPNGSGVFGDAFLAKFNNSGVQQWTTLIGGTQDEIGYGVCTDPSGEIFLTGYTASSNFPVSPGAYQPGFGGGTSDIIFARFSSNGNRIWSTYYGGTGNQRCLDIRVRNNHIYAAGFCTGTLPGPAGTVFQPDNAGGSGDGILVKLETTPSANQVVWRTFCGGSGDDGFDEMTINNAGNVVCGGWTNSGNYPATPNAYQVTPGGGYDGQIATIDPDGQLICATYFGGAYQTDNVYGLGIASNDDVFCTGNTGSTPAQGFVITPGAFQEVKGTLLDSYIARISEIPPPPIADFDANPISGCTPLSVNLDNNSTSINTCLSNTTWEWSFPGGNPATSTVENPAPVIYNANGTYTITLKVSNASGSNTTTREITVSSGLPVSVSPSLTICSGSSTTLTASGADSYTWSPATGLSASTGSTVSANPTSTTTYTVTGASNAGCSGTATVTVTVSPAIMATVSPDVGICSGGSTTLTAGGGSTYSWSPAAGLSATTGASVTATPANTTTYTVTVSDGSCPPATASVTVTILQSTVATVSPDASICSGGGGTTLTAGGGDTYTWSPATGLSSTSGASVNANPTSTTTYTVSVSSGSCPPATANVTITVVQAPQASVSPDVTICQGAQTILTASGGDTYTWSPPSGLNQTTGSSVTANPTATTTYTVSAGRPGCSPSTATVKVSVTSTNPPNAGPDAGICPGESVVLQGSGATSYSWSPSTGLSCADCPNPVASPSVSTTYTLTSAGGECPASADAVTISVWSLPAASAGPSQSVPRGQSITLQAGGGVAYRWLLDNSSAETIVVSPVDNTIYCVEVTNANGCSDTACASISVTEPIFSTLWIPNSFTPNEDLNNGLFQTPGINIIEYQAAIFNRWGELIHEWNDIEKGWDGTFRGMPVQDDVYAYRIRALGADGKRFNKTGMVLVIR
jgi:gliding motility-associated-like protein